MRIGAVVYQITLQVSLFSHKKIFCGTWGRNLTAIGARWSVARCRLSLVWGLGQLQSKLSSKERGESAFKNMSLAGRATSLWLHGEYQWIIMLLCRRWEKSSVVISCWLSRLCCDCNCTVALLVFIVNRSFFQL